MDSHVLIKIIHMSFGSLALLVLLLRTVYLFVSNTAPAQQNKAIRLPLVILQHLSYTVLTIAGVVLLIHNQFVVQPWFYGKVILFLVLLSASHKAFGRRDLHLQQRKAGAAIALTAFVGLLVLVMYKPNFSQAAPSVAPTSSTPAHVAAT